MKLCQIIQRFIINFIEHWTFTQKVAIREE